MSDQRERERRELHAATDAAIRERVAELDQVAALLFELHQAAAAFEAADVRGPNHRLVAFVAARRMAAAVRALEALRGAK